MAKISFKNSNAVFFNGLKKEVDNYFKEKNIKKTGNYKLYLKTILLIPASVAMYCAILWAPMPIWVLTILSGVLGLSLASIGFNVMHDACHGSYSSKKWVNELMGYTINTLGGNAFIWKQKHNIIHHTYVNVDGLDDDIAKSPLIRQCHTQKWVPAHRVQHLYLPLVYAITSFAWAFIMDFTKYFTNKVYKTPLQKMSVWDHIIFWFSKLMYVVAYVLVPLYFLGGAKFALFFCVMHFFKGTALALVFQLAHVVEETEFETVSTEDKVIENEFAIHQVKTTANFAMNNLLVNWYVGGLNFQIEHHLFPKISHVHYPALSPIVQKHCKLHGLEYNNNRTMTGAIASHWRFMKELGKKPADLSTATSSLF
jgi:linoleoyl-CoA desaturase